MQDLIEGKISRLVQTSKIYDLMQKMGGCSAIKQHYKHKLDKPEIELYEIIDLTYKLKNIRSGFNSCVYINLCTDSTFYVGYATDKYLDSSVSNTNENIMLSRLADHRDNGGKKMPSNMTYLFPVVSCLAYFPGDTKDEDLITILMSKCVKNNVRGGKWATPFIEPEYPSMTVEEIKNKLLERTKP